MLTSLIVCMLSAPAGPSAAEPTRLELAPIGEDLVPGPPRLPPGLPGAVVDAAGTYLPRPLDQAVSELVGYCGEGYPAVVRVAIEQARRVELVACSGRLEVAAAQAQLGRVEALGVDPGWPTWLVAVAVTGAVLLGGAAGYGVAAVGR